MKILAFFSILSGLFFRLSVINGSIAEIYPHHFYFGPEFLSLQLDTKVQGVRIHGTQFFWGFRLGYEYLRPQACYFGIDLLSTSSNADFHASQEGHSLSWNKHDKGFGNLEVRLGYTYLHCSSMCTGWTMTPFLGSGMYNVFRTHHNQDQGFEDALPYVAGGVHLKYISDCACTVGFNVKILRTLGAEQCFRSSVGKSTLHRNMWGGEIGLPITWYLDCAERWDLTFEPYFLSLDFSAVQNVYGAKVLLGYRL